MAFAGFNAVADPLLEQMLPHVGPLVAGAPIDDAMLQSGVRRMPMVLSESGHRATIPEAAATVLRGHDFLNTKLNLDGASLLS